jgi:hypothetical protein
LRGTKNKKARKINVLRAFAIVISGEGGIGCADALEGLAAPIP